MIYLILMTGVYCLHLLLKMHWITSVNLLLYLIFMLRVHRRLYTRMHGERRRFTEATEYLDMLLYAFSKEEKVDRALENVEAALVDGPMREKVREALDHLHMTFDDTDVMRESLRIVEEAYPCARICTVHDFVIHVENYGGRIDGPVGLLLADKKRWESRISLAIKERSKSFSDIVMSIAASLAICGIILYLPVMNMDVSQNVLCQLLTAVVIVLDDVVFLKAQKFLAVDWLKLDVSTDAEDEKRMEDFERYDRRKGIAMSLFLTLPAIAFTAAAFLYEKRALMALGFVLVLLMSNQHRVGRSLAKRNLIKSIKCAFPNWLMDIVLLLQSENVQMAVMRSQAHVPPVLKSNLARMVERLAVEPESARPYHEFLQEFAIPEVHSAMSMLFSISMGHSSHADRQIGELIDRNLEMLDAAEKERIRNRGSGMYLLFLAPVLTASLKLIVDMAVFMLSFLAGSAI